jgi:hypothetical protein
MIGGVFMVRPAGRPHVEVKEMLAVQILIAVFSLTGTILMFIAFPFSAAHAFPLAAFVLSGTTMFLPVSKRVKAPFVALGVVSFCLFLGFLLVLFRGAQGGF